MRKTVAALFVTLVAMLGIWVPSVSAAYVSNAKVVIIVGAVHGQTDSYRQRGDAAYYEAKKYTPNVTRVYSPNATWSKVKSATVNANIVIYMGHGNGWPSPYTYDPNYTTKDGFGLNATAGNGDNNVKYYGEPYVDDLDLAPNAIVLLHHLCYASGNSEPGNAEPSVSTAKQRATNYAAGFLRSPARAVIADGHMGAAYYLRALFTTNQSILSMWRNAPNYNGNEFSFASSRNAGRTVYMDPDSPTKSFYRSLVLKPTLTTRDVTGVVADTGVDPATFVVPGRASVGALGAELLADETGLGRRRARRRDPPEARLAAQLDRLGRRWRVRGGGSRRRIDHRLRPRDAADPARQRSARRGHRRRGCRPPSRPNDDDSFDTTDLSARFSETVDWTLRVTAGDGTVVRSTSGTGQEPVVTWAGLTDGAAVADGSYTYTFRGQDAWQNAPEPVAKSGTVKVDTTPPALSDVAQAAEELPWFSPNGDGSRDTFALKASIERERQGRGRRAELMAAT